MTITGNFERFQCFNFESNFLKNEHLFQKLEHRFLVKSTKVDSAKFPYKTALSEANVKPKIKWGVQNGPIKKSGVLPGTTLHFQKFYFSLKNALFPYKTALSKANFKTNRVGSTKWTYHKEQSFASNYFIFLKILFQFKDTHWEKAP